MTHLLKGKHQSESHIKSRVESRLKNGNYGMSESTKNKLLVTV